MRPKTDEINAATADWLDSFDAELIAPVFALGAPFDDGKSYENDKI